MNKITAALIMMSVALLTSCSTTFYQVYTTETSESISKNKNSLIFEDDNCIITYNLWKHGGDVGFTFYNKTEEMIFLNLEESLLLMLTGTVLSLFASGFSVHRHIRAIEPS